MNREVLYLVAIFVVGCIAITFRAIMFNLAGERFVARLRKQVISSMSDCILFKHIILFQLFSSILKQELGFFDKSR